MQPALTICERTGKWAVAWRRAARGADSQSPLHEVRGLEECRQAVSAAQAGFVLLEMTAENLAQLFEMLAWLQFDYPSVRAAVLADRGLGDYELTARQLGAIHVVDSPRRLAPLTGVVRRFLASLPQPQLDTREEIWQRLPWKPAITGQEAADAAAHRGAVSLAAVRPKHLSPENRGDI
jgi:hypothetical protein